MKKITLAFIIIASLMLGSCKQEETKNNAVTSSDSQAIKLDSALFNSTLEPGISISEAKKLKVGDEVVTSGKILGANSVFVEGRAIFVMGDPEVLMSCDLKENDSCKTPWDVCCEKKEIVNANVLSVQVVDQEGKVLKTGLKGKNGLKELALITVKGKIAPQSNDFVTIINASAIQVD